MDKDESMKIIIVLLVIIIALLAIICATMPHGNDKQDTKLIFRNNDTIDEGDSLKIRLTDDNGTGIVNQTVNITITNENNLNSYYSVVTDEDGDGKLELIEGEGEYNVTISYGGNDNYTGCNATQKLKIKEEVKETASDSTSSNSGGWTTVSPGGDAGSSIVTYHDGNGHMYVTRYFSNGMVSEDGVVYNEGDMITS